MNTKFLRASFLLVALSALIPASAEAQKKKSGDLLTREEILASAQKDATAFDAIKVLRPRFFEAPRGQRSLGGSFTNPIAIYIDKIRQPSHDVLYQIPASSIAEVRYLDPSRSQNEYGITANGGALVIKKYQAMSIADSLNKKPPQ